MAYEPTLIAPLQSGLVKYFKPFLIQDEAFPNLEDAYTFRGTVKKREGFRFLARLPSLTNPITAITKANPAVVTINAHGLSTGDMIYFEGIVGMTLAGGSDNVNSPRPKNLNNKPFLVKVLTPNTFELYLVNIPTSGIDTTGYTNYTSGGTAYLPVNGLKNYVSAAQLSDELLLAFTPKRAYLYSSPPPTFTVTHNATDGTTETVWTGTKNDFYAATNYATSLWVTNNIEWTATDQDGLKYYNDNPPAGKFVGWSTTRYVVNDDGTTRTTLDGGLILIPFKERLIIFNTLESVGGVLQRFPQRARWSQIGTPYSSDATPKSISNVTVGNPTTITSAAHGLTTLDKVWIYNVGGSVGSLLNFNSFIVTVVDPNNFTVPVDSTGFAYTSRGNFQTVGTNIPPKGYSIDAFAWRDDIPGRGGFIDADTSEQIYTVSINKDTVIVGFQYSTWRLRYIGNEVLPFTWERINTQLGSEATHATVPFDEGTLMISRRGIIAADTNSVVRIDEKIPDQMTIFDSNQSSLSGDQFLVGMNRIHSIRDFQKQLVMWTYGSAVTESQIPTNVLCYNYIEKSWSIFNQAFVTFGNFKVNERLTWSNWTTPWAGDESTWEDTLQTVQNSMILVSGDVASNVYEYMANDVATDNGTNFNFNILTKQYNPYFQQGAGCRLGYVDLYFETNGQGYFSIVGLTASNPVVITTNVPHNLTDYSLVTLQSIRGPVLLNNQQFQILRVSATQFSIPNVSTIGMPAWIPNSGFVFLTSEITLLHYIDDSEDPIAQRKVNLNLPNQQAKYTRIFLGGTGHFHQIELTRSNGEEPFLIYPPSEKRDNQLADPNIGDDPFILNGIVLWTRKISRIKG